GGGARAGLRPRRVAAAVSPGGKVCARWGTPEAMADVEVDPDKYPLTIQAFSACRFEFEGARHETRWRTPASYGIVRREFDHYLLDRARAAGTDVREGARVTAVMRDADGIRGVSEHGAFEASVVIGARCPRGPAAGAWGDRPARQEAG